MSAPAYVIPGAGRSCPRCGQTVYQMEASTDELLLRVVHLNPHVAACMVPVRTRRPHVPRTEAILSRRQHEALAHLARGMTIVESACALSCANGTVGRIRGEVLIKLRAVNAPHAVALAYQCGLLPHADHSVIPLPRKEIS